MATKVSNKKVYQTVTIKIGSNVLTRPDGQLDRERIAHITEDIAYVHQDG